jgi:hypothetical protein
MKIIFAFWISFLCIHVYACNRNDIAPGNDLNNTFNSDTMKLRITIGTDVFVATLNNNAAATAFKAKLPLTIKMTELNGNEKYYDLPGSLPVNASKPGTIQAGDLMLYGSNTIVLFYKTFSTSYNYTRLGRVENASKSASALGSGNVTVKFDPE